jgi:hypothetical protein
MKRKADLVGEREKPINLFAFGWCDHRMPVTRRLGFVTGSVGGPSPFFLRALLQPGERASEFLGPEGGQVVNPFADADEVDR